MITTAPGDVVAWWDDARLAIGVVLGEEKRRLRVAGPDGRSSRIPAGRVALRLERAAGGDAVQRAADAERRVDQRARSVEVEEIWELAADADDPPGLADLAELAVGEAGPVGCAALIRAFVQDGLHFVRKGDAWLPRGADAVERLRKERAVAGQREAERDRAAQALASAATGQARETRPGGPLFDRWVSALERLAILDLEAPDEDRRVAEEALRLAGIRGATPAVAAFRLLRNLGRFASDDINLQIERYGLRVEFPPDVTERAASLGASSFDRAGREDLTGLDAFTVDSRSTREIDDALTWESNGSGRGRIGIHVADPAAWIRPGDPVDVEALARGVTHYFPDARLPMLPRSLGEHVCSLVAGEERPALSILADIDLGGTVRSSRLVRSIVRVRRRLTYAEADDGQGPAWDDLLSAAQGLQARRAEAGALRIEMPEVEIRVDDDGRVVLERTTGGSPSQTVVSEAMILAGSIFADFCTERSVPAIFRTQAPPGDLPPLDPGAITDPVVTRVVRRRLRRGESAVTAGPHHALGLQRYMQATSPLRRFQDLANHRQIEACLAGDPPPYDEDAIRRIASATERAEIDARRAERAARRFWLLRYIEAGDRAGLDGVVVESGPRPVVWLVETGLEITVPAVSGAAEGDAVRLRVTDIHPRADVLRLRPDDGRD